MSERSERYKTVEGSESAPDMAGQGEPVGRVKTVGGYPDESEHTVEWLCKYKDLKDGDLLYTAPHPAEQSEVVVSEIIEAVANFVGSQKGGPFAPSAIEAAIIGQLKYGDVFTKLITSPTPSYSQQSVALVDALEQVIKVALNNGPLWHGSEQIVEACAVLATHRKGGEKCTTKD